MAAVFDALGFGTLLLAWFLVPYVLAAVSYPFVYAGSCILEWWRG